MSTLFLPALAPDDVPAWQQTVVAFLAGAQVDSIKSGRLPLIARVVARSSL